MIDFGESQFRIPKISVPIICQMMSEEQISGEIFVDDLGVHDYSPQQLIDFFNDDPPYFPLRTSTTAKPILVQKRWVSHIEVTGSTEKFQAQSGPIVSTKQAILYRAGLPPVEATILLDMPENHSRLLDLLNLGKRFFPALIAGNYCLVNAHRIRKIEEK